MMMMVVVMMMNAPNYSGTHNREMCDAESLTGIVNKGNG